MMSDEAIQNENKKIRYHVIDHIRGLNFISMVLYHLTWDLVYLYEMDWNWFRSDWAYFWQQSICWIFILLSGFCWSMGKKKWKRGFLVLGASALVSVVTCLFLPEERIVFGVLTLLGFCMLVMIPLEPLLKRIPAVISVFVSIGCFLLLRNVNRGTFGFEALDFGTVPEHLYMNIWTAFWGFPNHSFFSTDYFSFIPWLFLFLTGYFLFRIMTEHEIIHIFSGKREIKVLTFLGQHSLILYLLHQPFIYLILLLGSRLF